MAYYFDLLDTGRVEKEGALDPDTMCSSANCKIAVYAAASQAHDHTFKRL
jgi:hypothetical protein